MSERSVYHHLKRLVEAGLVESPRGRSYRGVRPTPLLLAALLGRPEEDRAADP